MMQNIENHRKMYIVEYNETEPRTGNLIIIEDMGCDRSFRIVDICNGIIGRQKFETFEEAENSIYMRQQLDFIKILDICSLVI